MCDPGAPKRGSDDQFFLPELKEVGQGERPFPAASVSLGGSKRSQLPPPSLLVKRLGGTATDGVREDICHRAFPRAGRGRNLGFHS